VSSTTLVVDVVAVLLGVHLLLMGCVHVLLSRRRGGFALCHAEILRRPQLVLVARPFELVSILKPLAGRDEDLDANLESFAHLKHHRYEVLFGVAAPTDAALSAARAFMARHPDVDARIVLTDPNAATNPKVAQLIGLMEAARGDVIVTSDSNVRVTPDYLAQVLAPLADPSCGLVTSIVAGTGEQSLGAALENLQLGAVITPSVVLSTLGLSVTVGKSMAMRRIDLERLGGFESVGEVLAEDLMLGWRFAEAGLRVATSFCAVENRNVVGSLAQTFERHARWAKLRRSISPAFFALEPLFTPIVVAMVGAAVAPSRRTLGLLVIAIVVQTMTAFVAAGRIRARSLPWRYAPLELVRTFVMLACWASAWVSRAVVWRGHAMQIGPGSVILPATPEQRTDSSRRPELATRATTDA
jgi:ceramide glucosyltransferase